MKQLVLTTLLTLLYAGSAAAHDSQCTYPIGPSLDASDGRVRFCTPIEYWPTDGRARYRITHIDDGQDPISCDLVVDGGAAIRFAGNEPGIEVASSVMPNKFGSLPCSVACDIAAGGNPWIGMCLFPARPADPLGAPGRPAL